MSVEVPEHLKKVFVARLYKVAVLAGTLAFGHLANLEYEESKKHMCLYLDCVWWLVKMDEAVSFEDAEHLLTGKFPDGFHEYVHRQLSDDPDVRKYRIASIKDTVTNA